MLEKSEVLLETAKNMLVQYHNDLKKEDAEIDLVPFEHKVKELCESITKLPKEEGQKFYSDLQNLSESLTELRDKLEEQKKLLKLQLQSLNNIEAAQLAYTKVQYSTEPSKEEENK